MTINASRPDGCEHHNSFVGSIVVASGAVPNSGEVSSGTSAPTVAKVKFGPLDMPRHVFDDVGTPLGTAAQSSGMGPHTTIANRTWAKNAIVKLKCLDSNITAAALDPTPWEYDGTNGRPTLVLDVTFAAFPASIQLDIEIQHTATR